MLITCWYDDFGVVIWGNTSWGTVAGLNDIGSPRSPMPLLSFAACS